MATRDRARYVESLTPEELDAEPLAMGRDPAVERAKAWAIFEEFQRSGRLRFPGGTAR